MSNVQKLQEVYRMIMTTTRASDNVDALKLLEEVIRESKEENTEK